MKVLSTLRSTLGLGTWIPSTLGAHGLATCAEEKRVDEAIKSEKKREPEEE